MFTNFPSCYFFILKVEIFSMPGFIEDSWIMGNLESLGYLLFLMLSFEMKSLLPLFEGLIP